MRDEAAELGQPDIIISLRIGHLDNTIYGLVGSSFHIDSFSNIFDSVQTEFGSIEMYIYDNHFTDLKIDAIN